MTGYQTGYMTGFMTGCMTDSMTDFMTGLMTVHKRALPEASIIANTVWWHPATF